MPERKLHVGVIGAGVGTLHLAAYKELPRVEIAALAGLDDDRVRRPRPNTRCRRRIGITKTCWRGAISTR